MLLLFFMLPPPYKLNSLCSFLAQLYQTQKYKRVGKSNPQLKLCVILAIAEPMGACNLNVHMTSQARNSLVLQLMLSSRSLCKQWKDKQGVYRLACVYAPVLRVCTHAYSVRSSEVWKKTGTDGYGRIQIFWYFLTVTPACYLGNLYMQQTIIFTNSTFTFFIHIAAFIQIYNPNCFCQLLGKVFL